MALKIKYLPNVIRLTAFALVVSTALMLFSVRAAATHVREGMMSFGREMMEYADRHSMGQTRTLQINGAYLQFASGSTSDNVDRVLSFYQQRCGAHDGLTAHLTDQVGQVPPPAPLTGASASAHAPATQSSPRQRTPGTLRVDEADRGYVACFDVGSARLTPAEIVRRLRAFVASGDLAEVGRMRYLYAERSPTGRTRFIGFWSDGEVNVRHMFPTTGDVPGEDPADVPRPAGMRRLLDAREIDRPYSMSIFSGAGRPEAVEAQFRDQMPRHGWSLIPMRGPAPDLQGQRMVTYERGNVTATVILGSRRGDHTTVTVLMAE